MSKGKILFQLSGSIACYKACFAISRLVQAGYEVETIATKSALEFVGIATLEGLTGKVVHTDTYAPGGMMNHIHLARWADLIILAPATANTLAKMANGIGDDLVTTVFLAHDFEKPYLVAPAMNTQMLRHPATRESIQKLKDWGVEFLESGTGSLACGETGEGRLIEPDQLVEEITKRFEPFAMASDFDEELPPPVLIPPPPAPKKNVGLRILVTSGGTREPIDGVRAITNTSTGRLGAVVCDVFRAKGHDVTLLRAEGANAPAALPLPLREITFVTFGDLKTRLEEELSTNDYDAVVHLAAVSDFSVSGVEGGTQTGGKIESEGDLSLKLKRNPKLVDSIRSISKNPSVQLVAFKLTDTLDEGERLAAVHKLGRHARAQLIVHNDASDVTAEKHVATLYKWDNTTKEAIEIDRTETKPGLANLLERVLVQAATTTALGTHEIERSIHP